MDNNSLKETFSNTGIKSSARKGDSLKVWEQYRDQALLWRALTLFQLPITILSLIMCLSLYWNKNIEITVPHKPAPGIYHPNEIPESEFINVATEFVNYVASYTPPVAKKQFFNAREFLIDPVLTEFNNQVLSKELNAIEKTGRTQLFFIDPSKTVIEKNPQQDIVNVSIFGERLRMIAKQSLPLVKSKYTITLRIIPRNTLNPYGIVISGVQYKSKVEF